MTCPSPKQLKGSPGLTTLKLVFAPDSQTRITGSREKVSTFMMIVSWGKVWRAVVRVKKGRVLRDIRVRVLSYTVVIVGKDKDYSIKSTINANSCITVILLYFASDYLSSFNDKQYFNNQCEWPPVSHLSSAPGSLYQPCAQASLPLGTDLILPPLSPTFRSTE